MDRKYIENEHVVERYLSGDLTVREAREFEKFCLDHPQFLAALPIPVRLKTRLARRPVDGSETGVFEAIPSSATRVAMEASDDGFDPEEAREEMRRSSSGGGGVNRLVVLGLLVAVLVAAGTAVIYAMQASSLTNQLQAARKDLSATQMQAPGSVQKYKVELVKAKPAQPTLAIGWGTPPQLIELNIDATEGKMTQFQITIDKTDGVRVMQIRRVTRDSNKELRLGLNSSAFGPGDYLVKVEGYNWRGQTDLVGWMMLGLQ